MRNWTLLALLFFIPGFSYCQFIIKGKVLDAESNLPLEFATVFINNTTLGSITDKEGNFEIKTPEGKYELIISFIGYQTFSYSFNTSFLADNYTFKVFPEVFDLDEANVSEKRDKEWYTNLELFSYYFLGNSTNAQNCKIKNPEVLVLDKESNKNILSAKAKEPIIIDNPNLGFTIQYVLESFEHNLEQKTTTYAGFPFFIDHEPKNKRRLKSINEQRLRAYYGSLTHFMRSLYENNLENEGFKVYGLVDLKHSLDEEKSPLESLKAYLKEDNNYVLLDSLTRISIEENKSVKEVGISEKPLERDFLVEFSRNGLLFFTYPNPIFIVFLKEYEEPGFRSEIVGMGSTKITDSRTWEVKVTSADRQQISRLNILGKAVQILENGSYFHPLDIFVEGYMAWEKVADLMPLDFKLELKK